MDKLEIDFDALARLKPVWHELSQDLRVAVTDLEETPTAGFPATVKETVKEFLQVWAGATGPMATEAEKLRDDLESVINDFSRLETDLSDALIKTKGRIR